GLLTCARLVEAGITGVRLIEKGGDVGGTWYWNRYPGAQCDTAAMVYLPLLEETGHMPSEKYTKGPEILEHSRRIARHFGLYDHAVLSTEVTSLEWDDQTRPEAPAWVIRTNRGDVMRARHVAVGTGPLHRPKLPGIPGIETFGGHSFHTSRWDYELTGGDPEGGLMTGLARRRVGIIGTGATAVQCVPHLGRAVDQLGGSLKVFQRTPSSIDVRDNRPIDPDWFEQLGPGWQAEWLHNFTVLQTGGFADDDLVEDGWTDIAQRIRDRIIEHGDFSPEGWQQAYEDSDDAKMTEIRARVDEIIGDPETAAALKPWYRQLCKRPCFHDEYLQTFNLPAVELVDTDGRGVERIDEHGVWVDGVHHELDVLIHASGFEVGTETARRAGFETTGRDGRTLTDAWADGMRSLHGIHVHGFPNLYVVGPAQGANLISNVPHNLVERARTITAIVSHAASIGATEVEVTEAAQDAWVERLIAGDRRFRGGGADCTPGYYNNEGQDAGDRGVLNSLGFPEGPVAYFEYIDAWRNSGEFDGLDIRT
ncbi:MAG: NAD(P)/FAD-dependent oxidoreductase, partial [Actinomycetota bacterium]